MAYHVEQNPQTGKQELVVDGFEQGISDAPELGIADMRNINNDSIPGIALCNFKLVQVSQTPISAQSFTADATADTITWTGTALQKGAAIKFTAGGGGTLPGGIVAGTVYYALSTGNTTQITTTFDPGNGFGNHLDITNTGTPPFTFATVNMGTLKDYTTYTSVGVNGNNNFQFVIDSNGRTWIIMLTNGNAITPLNFPILLANETKVGNGSTAFAYGNGIVIYKSYLFVFRNATIDAYGSLTGASPSWTNDWATLQTTNNSPLTVNSHHAKWGQDNIAYYCDANYVGSIHQSGNIDTLGTYAQNNAALTLPVSECANWLEEPSVDTANGNLIYIGTSTSNLIYPWDKYTTNYFAPLPMPEIGCYKMLNINKIVYILAGQRGNIYYTNGSTIILFKSVPKQPTKNPYSLFSWGGIMSLNNNLCFGVADKTASGSAQNNASGCWAITLAVGQLLNSIAGAIRYKNQPSTGTLNTDVIIPLNNGMQFFAGSFDGTNGFIDLLDTTTPTFYSNYESYLETDIIPIGTALNPANLSVIEAKLDTELVSGDKFRISMRSDLTPTYTQLFEQSTVGAIDGFTQTTPLQNLKWVQLKAELQTVSGGSYTRLRQIRFR